MFGKHHGCHDDHSCTCGCHGMMSVDDEIRALEVHQAHLKLQLDMVEKRIAGLKTAGT